MVAVLPDSVCDAGIVIFALVLSESECNEFCNLIGISRRHIRKKICILSGQRRVAAWPGRGVETSKRITLN